LRNPRLMSDDLAEVVVTVAEKFGAALGVPKIVGQAFPFEDGFIRPRYRSESAFINSVFIHLSDLDMVTFTLRMPSAHSRRPTPRMESDANPISSRMFMRPSLSVQ
jgi:hypothetical protein